MEKLFVYRTMELDPPFTSSVKINPVDHRSKYKSCNYKTLRRNHLVTLLGDTEFDSDIKSTGIKSENRYTGLCQNVLTCHQTQSIKGHPCDRDTTADSFLMRLPLRRHRLLNSQTVTGRQET